VVLTGIHLGGYGLDLSPATTLLELVRQVAVERAVPRLRLGSIEPMEISPALIDFMARTPTICQHLHIPMQSGSDRILALMGRKYTSAGFREVVSQLVTAMPDICCGADIIVGFPGETDDDFEQTCNLLRNLSLAYFHVFPFSPRQGTPAAAMADPVPAHVIRERVQLLRRLSDRKKDAYYRRFIGEELQVLVQGGKADGRLLGLSRNYIPVGMTGDRAFINSEVTLRITSVTRDSVQGELVSST
jgi:threonylcarbamoyladenosine tRNA methylthiotransferase MtaB